LSVTIKNEIKFKDLMAKCDKCKDTKKVKVFDVCPKCDGVGCNYCEKGFIPTMIPCPQCVPKSPMKT
jgi:RecJ-like exonuclease